MRTITRSLMLAVLMLAFVSTYAQKQGGEGDNVLRKKIQAYNNQMTNAIIENDHEKVLSFYDENVISLPNYNEMLRGMPAVSEHHRQAADMGNKVTAMKLTTKKITEYGDALVEIGTFTVTMEVARMPQPITDEGKYLNVWLKQKDGSYKIVNEIWNSDTHPMKMSGAQQKGDINPNSEKPKQLENSGGQTKSGSEKKLKSSSEKKR